MVAGGIGASRAYCRPAVIDDRVGALPALSKTVTPAGEGAQLAAWGSRRAPRGVEPRARREVNHRTDSSRVSGAGESQKERERDYSQNTNPERWRQARPSRPTLPG